MTLTLWWAAATMLGWLLAHPILALLAREALPLWATAVVVAVALVSLARALVRRRRGLPAQWRAVAIDAGWAIVAVIALASFQPGSMASVFQWPLLRPFIPASPAWMLASTVGSGLAWS